MIVFLCSILDKGDSNESNIPVHMFPLRAIDLIKDMKNILFIDPILVHLAYLMHLSDGGVDIIAFTCDRLLEETLTENGIISTIFTRGI